MCERMLDKEPIPTMEAFWAHCGAARPLIEQLYAFLTDDCGAQWLLRFPYGNRYGWGIKYSVKGRLLCDVFAEKDAFTVMVRMGGKQIAAQYDALSDHGKWLVDDRYPCGDGGWVNYRVQTDASMDEVQSLLGYKATHK